MTIVTRVIWLIYFIISLASGTRDMSLDCECGRQQINKQMGRIIGGDNASPHEFPWMVKLWVKDSRWHFCGGSIISDRVILTAGHCISPDGEPPGPHYQYHVIVHAHEGYKSPKTDGIAIPNSKISGGVAHPGYYTTYGYDAGLIFLKEPLDFTKMGDDGRPLYLPVCLPEKGKKLDLVGKDAMMTGWGLIDRNQSKPTYSDVLKKLVLKIIPMKDCLTEEEMKEYITAFCTGTNLNEGGSYGDSGGPTTLFNDGKHTIIGISSHQKNATFEASLEADVQEFIDFIEEQSNKVGARYCKS